MKLLAGALLVVLHVLAFRWLASHDDTSDFTVEINNGVATPSTHRAIASMEGSAPGLVRQRWSIDYRGGFSRSVYDARLAGPFQDPDHLACSGRVVVAQSLLDDGNASEGTLAAEIVKEVTSEMRGTSVWPAGSFTRVEHISVKWARLELHPDDWAMIGQAPHGYVQVSLRIGFDRVSVPIVLAVIPNDPSMAKTPELSFKVVSRADFSFDNRVLQFLDDKLGGNKLATKLARDQIDGLILTALAPPPPFALDDKPDGQTLQFTYCDQLTEVADGMWGALPFAVMLGRVSAPAGSSGRSVQILPPKRGPAPHIDINPNAQIAIDLDLDALNAILYELWRGGYLDEKLAEAGLDKAFNNDATVASLLSIRVSPPRLALPPVVTPRPGFGDTAHARASEPLLGVLRLSADARINIADGAADDPKRTSTVGRVWGSIDFAFLDGAFSRATTLSLDELALACERGPSTPTHAVLAPCYGDLVSAMRDRGGEFDAVLTNAFARLLHDVFVERRLSATGLPSDLLIHSAVPGVISSGENASLHLDLGASLVPTQ